ncbi:MAG: ImmA/IrrE family metallo-endopeptidase [Alphaproteobacteria bacterium]|nr:ImmA/IrrE family metallo-endopeptidase [Alphaproteobacteria bacterium]
MTRDRLRFSLEWMNGEGRERRLTTAFLMVSLNGDAIWPVQGAPDTRLEIQADDLLSHLTEFWKPLMLRQTYPVEIQPDRPSRLRFETEKRWGRKSADAVEREEELIDAFEEAHDLSRSFAGQFDLPPLWLFREADSMLVETRHRLHTVDYSGARDALTAVGDEIATRLEQSDRCSDLVRAWRDRDGGDAHALLAWSASLDPALARSFAAENILQAPRTVTEAANDDDELRIAARMASALPAEQVRQIIELVRGLGVAPAPRLDELAASTMAHLRDGFSSHGPHERGEAAAIFVRERLGLASVQRADIFAIVTSLGVSLHTRAVEPETLMALAVWGSRHGPSVLLNEKNLKPSKPVDANPLARVNLAHELCHLLLDGGHTLSAIEILHSRMPADIERRAKQFSGELLLPGRVAADIWFAEKKPQSVKGLSALLSRLCRTYGVTTSVAAWKLEHGLRRHDIDLGALLDQVAPNR